ncbi:MAG: metallophosphoesterase [Candidatus Heimdallarchaeum endolithica]|uniref:Metallophosphoesterase n=1 Tax=Candidatus Heimdallarchaeum endolithica TaxID=2876572 RepID=A0A9Y1BQX5_9ARCH|nr:MAG: metallophosphoesterase [Candidatus Heimdallarchaeum endolithica]
MHESQERINFFPIAEDINILDASPIVYLKDIRSLVIADVHLGLETIMAEDGVAVLKTQTEKLTKKILFYIKKIKPIRLIINGDLKHSFNEPTKVENREVKEFLNVVSLFIREVVIVKGNHDVFLSWVTRDIENCKLVEDLVIERYFFTHGHKNLPEDLPESVEFVLIGHEHPLFHVKLDELQVVKMKSLLIGPLNKEKEKKVKHRKLIVLPAFSSYSGGNPITPKDQSSLLSPILRNNVELSEFESFVLLESANDVLHFPPFKKWY